jgi:peptidyl-dipeptidase A
MSHLRWCRFAAVALSSALAVAPAGILAQTPSRLALGGPPPSVRTEAELRAFLDELEAQELALGEATTLEAYYQWQGKARHFTGAFARLQTDLVTRRDYAAVIDRWQGKVRDSTLARRLFLHHRDFLAARADPRLSIQLVDLQTAIQDTVTAFRFDVRGRKLTLTGIGELLDTAADRSLREAAFRSRLQVTPHTMPSIVRALSLLDRIGRQEGFANGAAAGLNNSSLEPRRVLRDLDEFERATRPTYLAMLRRVRADLRVDRVEGWDVGYWLHQQETAGGVDPWPKEAGLERLRGLMRAIGFAVDSLPIDIRIWDVPTGGITFPVRPPYEARLLSNPFSGSDFYSTLFHEYGHAANFTLMDPTLPAAFFRGDETPLGEGLAETLGYYAADHDWLERAAGVTQTEAVRLERAARLRQLLWLRRTIALGAYAEITQYLDRKADLDSLYAAAYGRFVGVELPPGHWFATRDMFATGPLYFQSYLYANMIAAQLREAMREQFGVEDLSAEPRVAAWLTERFFRMGAAVPWEEKVRRATGRPLSSAALARYLAEASP